MSYDPKKIVRKNKHYSDDDIQYLHPKVQEIARKFLVLANFELNNLGYEVKIAETIRSYDDQFKIYSQGRKLENGKWIEVDKSKIVSKARPGRSVHNWGCAFDIRIIKNGKYIRTDENKVYSRLGAVGRNLGLFWGGDFRSIKDMPHYQYTGKYSNDEFLNLANAGKPIDELLK